MKVAYFDCYSGISGDMAVGALIDAGVDFAKLSEAVATLPIDGFSIDIEEVSRCGIKGTKFNVNVSDSEKNVHRQLVDIEEIIANSGLTQSVKDRATEVFQKLAGAESQVHGSTVKDVHFHEVGCIDAIIDIVGAMFCIEELDVETVVSSPLSTGCGTIKTAHGVLPVPVPATVELLKNIPTKPSGLQGELVTPTGAAIVTTLAGTFGDLPKMRIQKVGYGAGSRQYEGRTNMLRVMIGESMEVFHSDVFRQELVLITTEIDDMNPEIFPDVMEKLLEAKCLDVHFVPIYMKKGRPAYRLEALCAKETFPEASDIILRHTSTFGFKAQVVDRFCLKRDFKTIKTNYGEVTVKVGYMNGKVIKVAPEFEDCKRIAAESNVSVLEVYNNAIKHCEDVKDSPSV